ncbi:MAG: GC-type dockerin domain-anchored protein [Phycisphaerales bacterium JB064]
MKISARHVVCVLLACAGAAHGQATIEWAATADGLFSQPSNWLPAVVPGVMDTAVLGRTGAYLVMLDTSPTIAGLTLANPDAMLGIDNGRILTISADGHVAGPGAVLVNVSGGSSTTRLQLRSNAVLNTSVLLNTPAAAGPGLRAQVTALGPAPTSIGVDGLITGRGRVAGVYENAGTIEANGPDSELQLVRADVQHPTGLGGLRAIDGGLFTLIDSTVQGATWNASGLSAGRIGASSGAIVDARFEGPWSIEPDSRFTIEGALGGDGTLSFDPNPAAIGSLVTIGDGATLDMDIDLGFRTLLMRSGTGPATIGPNATITGRGTLEGRFDLHGAVIADGGSSEIFWLDRAGELGPDARLLARNGGEISIFGEPLTDATFEAQGTGTFNLDCSLTNATFAADGPGAMIDGEPILIAPRFEGDWGIAATRSYLDGTLSGPGRIRGLSGDLRTIGDAVIDLPIRFERGRGRIVPDDAGAPGTVELSPNVVVDGYGTLQGQYVSRALFEARARGQILELERCQMVMEAGSRVVIENEGQLSLHDTTLTTPVIEAGDMGRIVMFEPALITGGRLVSDGGVGQVRGDFDGCVLEDTQLEGRWGVSNGGHATLAGMTTSTRGDGQMIINAESLGGATTLWVSQDAVVDVPIVLNMAPTATQFFAARLARTGDGLAELGPDSMLLGRGQVFGHFRVAGVIAPGGQPAGGQPRLDRILLNQATLELTPTARVELELAGPDATQRDRLDGTGELVLGGTLAVHLVDGYTPEPGDRIELLRPAVLSGAFASYEIDPAASASGVGPAHVVYTGNIATLVICAADRDGDGELTVFDFLEFQNQFDAGAPRADLDGDGTLTIFDFLMFQNAFDAGCE